jgi:hypothetical protein
MKLNTNTILLIIVALVIAAGAYWYLFTGNGAEAPLSASLAPINSAQSQFTLLVSELKPINFTTDIFTDPSFTGLIDISTPVLPEQAGRPDPFAPIVGVPTR